jgi:hypothetical protein
MAALRLPDLLTRYSAPSTSSQSSSSESYDYSGQDDLTKKQDAIGALRDAKFEANLKGDPSAVTAGNKVRELVKAVRTYLPGATERDPGPSLTPLVRVTSRNSSGSSSFGGGGWEGQPEPQGRNGGGQQAPLAPQPVDQKPPVAKPAAPRKPAVKPPMQDARIPGTAAAAMQRRLDELNAGIDSDAAFDVSDAPLAPDGVERRFRFPMA